MQTILADVARRIKTAGGSPYFLEESRGGGAVLRDMHRQNATHILEAHTLALASTGSATIGPIGDVLIGFHLPGGASSLALEIGGRRVWEARDLETGRFVYAADDESAVPMVCLRFHEIKVHVQQPAGGVRAIVLVLDSFHRRSLMGWVRGPRRPDGTELRYHSGISSVSVPGASSGGCAVAFPNMRHIPLVFDAAVLPETMAAHIVAPLVAAGLLQLERDSVRCSHTPAPCVLPAATLAALNRAVASFAASGRSFRVVGRGGVLGCTDAGMHEHRDETYQEGGEAAVLFYLTTVDEGGETVFDASNHANNVLATGGGDGGGGGARYEVRPTKGRAVLFDPRAAHHARPVVRGHKVVLTVEVAFG